MNQNTSPLQTLPLWPQNVNIFMKAFQLVRFGPAVHAFDLTEMPDPIPGDEEVMIETEGFGLNYADVMARLRLYNDCPPLPCVIGYEVVGRVSQKGKDCSDVEIGDRVTAFTRFGGYAEKVTTNHLAISKVGKEMPLGEAAALATQYCTAWYAAEETVRLHEGDKVLIHAAAGGVGNGLVQLCKRKGCEIYATAGSQEKLDFLRELGVDHTINYRQEDFFQYFKKKNIKLDVIFDSIGGDSMRKGWKLLDAGGRLVMFGAAKMSDATNIFKKISVGLGFGIYHPAQLMMSGKSLIGVSMLPLADHKPLVLKRCLDRVTELYRQGDLKPVVGGTFKASQLAEAHEFLANRKSIGKVVVTW